MADCIFCKIIQGSLPALVIHENAEVITFLSTENHPLVVPKKHIPDIYDLDDRTGSAIMAEIVHMSRLTKRAVACEGVRITQANGSAAGQHVFHIHFHIYPRWTGVEAVKVPVPENERQERLLQFKTAMNS